MVDTDSFHRRQCSALTLGERYVAWARAEMAAGVCEVPSGSNTGPRIVQYHSVPVRDGRKLGLRRGPWCASAYSFGIQGCAEPGELPEWWRPRCSGYELEQDAKRAGAWRDVEQVSRGLWWPAVGDACILARGNTSWQRHVCAVKAPPGPTTDGFHTIGGNEADRWRATPRSLFDAEIRGFIELPRLDPVDTAVTEASRNAADAAGVVLGALERIGGLYG